MGKNMVLMRVVSQQKYAVLAVASAALMAVIYVYSQVLFIADNVSIWLSSAPLYNLFLFAVFAVLFGLTVSLQAYRWRQPKTCSAKTGKSIAVASPATFLGFLVAQCPACASLAALLLPVSAASFFVQYNTVLNIVSIGMLLFSLNYLGAFRKE